MLNFRGFTSIVTIGFYYGNIYRRLEFCYHWGQVHVLVLFKRTHWQYKLVPHLAKSRYTSILPWPFIFLIRRTHSLSMISTSGCSMSRAHFNLFAKLLANKILYNLNDLNSLLVYLSLYTERSQIFNCSNNNSLQLNNYHRWRWWGCSPYFFALSAQDSLNRVHWHN